MRWTREILSGITTDNHVLHIATTNYDMLPEYSFEKNGLNYSTGFYGMIERKLNWNLAERPFHKCKKILTKRGLGSQNAVVLSLVGTVKKVAGKEEFTFTRSILTLPDIESICYVLKHSNLEKFMSLLSKRGEAALELGKYTMDDGAAAYLDGNKFFQRHAAILGSTGSGKSWTVASILEKAAALPSSNLIVFDLHGEYRNLLRGMSGRNGSIRDHCCVSIEISDRLDEKQLGLPDKKRDAFIEHKMIWWIQYDTLKKNLLYWAQLRQLYCQGEKRRFI